MVADPILALQQMIDSNIVGVGIAAATGFVGLLNAWIDVRAENRTNRLKEDLKEWVNGSFMRASTVEAKLETMEATQDALQREVADLRQHGCVRVNTHFPIKDR